MRTYTIAVFTGDLSKPIQRVLVQSLLDLYSHLEGYDDDRECSAIIHELDEVTGDKVGERIFFGTKAALLKQEDPGYLPAPQY